MAAFLKRRNKTDDIIPQFQTADHHRDRIAREEANLAAEEAKDDWKNKSKIEKQRLARIEMRRRKQARRGILSRKFWSLEMAAIFLVSCTAIVVLLFLLNHRSSRRRVLGHSETWKETFEEVLHIA